MSPYYASLNKWLDGGWSALEQGGGRDRKEAVEFTRSRDPFDLKDELEIKLRRILLPRPG
jgi:hypothetical protein